ncbi:MAG: MATE family efflux transporter [Verrucomicrobiales bacterium]|jgi:putative MATE family efflux protein|nr:MATE family efflux transporter [Verrucomicrobiales bacterium]HQZ29731.1 MATE family efflux transporter [Verrucomicrobiales bacterium]
MKAPPSLTTDPIRQLTWRIALPTSVGMFFQTMFNFVDTYFAGKLHTDALAALSLSFPVFFLLVAAGSGLSQGSTSLIANAFGENNLAAARRIFSQSLLLATGAGIVLSVVGYFLAPALFQWLGAEGHYLSMCLAYMRVILVGGMFFLLSGTVNAGLAALGENRPYRNFLVIGFIANCLLNPLLMNGFWMIPPLGVSGIAAATVVIQAGGVFYLWKVVSRTAIASDLPAEMWYPHRATLREIADQSIPAALNMLTIAAGIFVMTWYVKHFGKEAVAAAGIATRIEQIFLMPVIGLGSAMLSIVGQNHGAGFSHRVREAWVTNIREGIVLMILGGVILGFGGPKLVRFFTSDEVVIGHGRDYLFTAAITLAAYPILFVTVFLMQGLKRPAYGLWIGIYRQLLAPLIVYHTLVFGLGWGTWGVWWGVCLVTWSAALFTLAWGWRVVSKMTAPLDQSKEEQDKSGSEG